MVKVKFLSASVFLVLLCSKLSLARRPYFSDEDDALESLDEEQQETSLSSLPRPARRLHTAHALASMATRTEEVEPESQAPEDEEVDTTPMPVPQQHETLQRIQEHNRSEEDNRGENHMRIEEETQPSLPVKSDEPVACTCGIFMTGQFQKASKAPPKGNPIVMTEMEETFQCNPAGKKQCTNKCLEILIKHLPNSPALICAAADRDIHKERAYLFVKNCEDEWHNSNLSAGREYCCKDNEILKCPSS